MMLRLLLLLPLAFVRVTAGERCRPCTQPCLPGLGGRAYPVCLSTAGAGDFSSSLPIDVLRFLCPCRTSYTTWCISASVHLWRSQPNRFSQSFMEGEYSLHLITCVLLCTTLSHTPAACSVSYAVGGIRCEWYLCTIYAVFRTFSSEWKRSYRLCVCLL